MDDIAIKANELSKKFSGNYILKNISFEIPEKSTTFIQGANGSGKSVTLKLIAGFLHPTEGDIQRKYKKVSYTPDNFPSNLNFTILEYLDYISKVYNQKRETTLYYLELFKLNSQKKGKLKYCSKGTLQKINIIQSLLSDSDVYLFDEPLSGLDSATQDIVKTILNDLKGTATVVFTSHENEFATSICTHVLDMKTGFVQNVNDVSSKQVSHLKRIITKFSNDALELLRTYTTLTDLKYDSDIIFITLPSDKSDQVIKSLIERNNHIIEVKELFNDE
ncbi:MULTISPECIES: ATP-binding cassette domain-containing protein [Staphylococcus]|uniref:ABC transporter ATP-binding protein n=1 Tax=Staphylococcus equorum TaxID=246432 RepID=A0A9X4R1U5_9STAP|nr:MULTISPECIES: ABC transporter ATP-binding protein [Staphylococcus]MDG0842912.1 ABC transporter ATP-binding protein [Staphylococcus equorum]MDG0859466.1 ABC transporter ATP-binding protein [Staphylococcus equorum]